MCYNINGDIMIYLDYSATTPLNDLVLESYVEVSKNYIGNANSLHALGYFSNKLEKMATKQISNIFKVKESEIIYTSGASEANNMCIFGLTNAYHRGKTIITTKLEHESILEPLRYLEKDGYKIVYAPLKEDGTIDLEAFEKLLNDDTFLVTVAAVSSELGIRQPIEKLGLLLKKYPKIIFHSDITQAVGKVKIDLENVDLASLSAHKIYGPKGIGILVKKDNINLVPLIMGGKSTTKYRAGTPPLPLIVAFSKALRLIMDINDEHILKLNKYILDNIDERFLVNSTKSSIPHIINISLSGVKGETILRALEDYEIYVSTKTACSSDDYSHSIFALYNDEERSKGSIRISLSYLTKVEEVEFFVKTLNNISNDLLI